MKKLQDSLNPYDWIRVARKDWHRMKRSLQDNDPEAAGFFFQQSLEKYLKAFLLQHGWELRKIHALHDLLSEAVKYKPEIEPFRKLCEHVSGYYLADRYPPLIPLELACGDIQKETKEAESFIQFMFPEENLNG